MSWALLFQIIILLSWISMLLGLTVSGIVKSIETNRSLLRTVENQKAAAITNIYNAGETT